MMGMLVVRYAIPVMFDCRDYLASGASMVTN